MKILVIILSPSLLTDLDENIQDCVKMLDGYISDLRNYMRMLPWDPKGESLATLPPSEEEEEDMEEMFNLPIEVQKLTDTLLKMIWVRNRKNTFK